MKEERKLITSSKLKPLVMREKDIDSNGGKGLTMERGLWWHRMQRERVQLFSEELTRCTRWSIGNRDLSMGDRGTTIVEWGRSSWSGCRWKCRA